MTRQSQQNGSPRGKEAATVPVTPPTDVQANQFADTNALLAEYRSAHNSERQVEILNTKIVKRDEDGVATPASIMALAQLVHEGHGTEADAITYLTDPILLAVARGAVAINETEEARTQALTKAIELIRGGAGELFGFDPYAEVRSQALTALAERLSDESQEATTDIRDMLRGLGARERRKLFDRNPDLETVYNEQQELGTRRRGQKSSYVQDGVDEDLEALADQLLAKSGNADLVEARQQPRVTDVITDPFSNLTPDQQEDMVNLAGALTAYLLESNNRTIQQAQATAIAVIRDSIIRGMIRDQKSRIGDDLVTTLFAVGFQERVTIAERLHKIFDTDGMIYFSPDEKDLKGVDQYSPDFARLESAAPVIETRLTTVREFHEKLLSATDALAIEARSIGGLERDSFINDQLCANFLLNLAVRQRPGSISVQLEDIETLREHWENEQRRKAEMQQLTTTMTRFAEQSDIEPTHIRAYIEGLLERMSASLDNPDPTMYARLFMIDQRAATITAAKAGVDILQIDAQEITQAQTQADTMLQNLLSGNPVDFSATAPLTLYLLLYEVYKDEPNRPTPLATDEDRIAFAENIHNAVPLDMLFSTLAYLSHADYQNPADTTSYPMFEYREQAADEIELFLENALQRQTLTAAQKTALLALDADIWARVLTTFEINEMTIGATAVEDLIAEMPADKQEAIQNLAME